MGLPWRSGAPVAIPPARPDRFLGLDLFGGAAAYRRKDVVQSEDPSKHDDFENFGWNAGATVGIGVRWLGITGAVGRQTIDTAPTYQLAVGPRLTSPWLPLGEIPIRGFAHALVGIASTTGVTPSQSSAEWVIGGVVPLCLRGCRESDAFNVSGRPASQ